MEPLSAVSLAGNILQFVQFATGLFNSAQKLRLSETGSSAESDSIEVIFGRLSELSSGLTTEGHGFDNAETPEDTDLQCPRADKSAYGPQLRSLAETCQKDCTRLLEIVKKLNIKTASGPGWWKGFQVAWREAIKSAQVQGAKGTDLRLSESDHDNILRYIKVRTAAKCAVVTTGWLIHWPKREHRETTDRNLGSQEHCPGRRVTRVSATWGHRVRPQGRLRQGENPQAERRET